MLYCSNCGRQLPDGCQFCPECGTQTNAAAPVTNSSAAPGDTDRLPVYDPLLPLQQSPAPARSALPAVAGIFVALALAAILSMAVLAGTGFFDASPGDSAAAESDEEASIPDDEDEEGEEESAEVDPDAELTTGKNLLERGEATGDRALTSEAFDAFSRAADAGSIEANYYLGYCYYYGVGVARSYDKAYEHALVSANDGDARAQALIGRCLYDGTGVAQDREECYSWAVKSADQGNPEGMYLLGNCYKRGYVVGVDYDLMLYWYERSAAAGDDNGMVNLGVCYDEAIGVTRDLAYAIELYQQAADMGNSYAQLYLAQYYYEGTGVPKDVDKARSYAEKAANNERDPRASGEARSFLSEHGL